MRIESSITKNMVTGTFTNQSYRRPNNDHKNVQILKSSNLVYTMLFGTGKILQNMVVIVPNGCVRVGAASW